MEAERKKLPNSITQHINEHYKGALVSSVARVPDTNERNGYVVEFSLEETSYMLRFDPDGVLKEEMSEPAYAQEYDKERNDNRE